MSTVLPIIEPCQACLFGTCLVHPRQTYLPVDLFTRPYQPVGQVGWICPNCGQGMAPWVLACCRPTAGVATTTVEITSDNGDAPGAPANADPTGDPTVGCS